MAAISAAAQTCPLCADGRAQLEELKAKFQYPDVPLVFCSPMLRAQQTAEVLFPQRQAHDFAGPAGDELWQV